MNFRDFLHNSAGEIDQELSLFFKDWSKEIEQVSKRFIPYGDALSDACRGGKRIRGALVLFGYGLAESKKPHPNPFLRGEGIKIMINRDILRVAVAVEIFQAAILGHDDIIDKSDLRRGEPSLYVRCGGGHEGVSKAICLGDIGFFLAFKIIAGSGFGEKKKNKALRVFSETMLDTGLGELLDVDLSMSDRKDSIETGDVVNVYRLKTAYYTISAPLVIGGILGGLKNTQLDAIKLFGQYLGIAFQIKDDINDIFSGKDKLGKDAGGDIKEGKQTLLYLYATGHVNGQQKKILEDFYGNLEIGEKEIDQVRGVLRECGALRFAEEEVERYVGKAKKYISKISDGNDYKKMLLEMCEVFVK